MPRLAPVTIALFPFNMKNHLTFILAPYFLKTNAYSIKVGDFMEYSHDGTKNVISPAMQRFNIDAVAAMSITNGSSIEIKTVDETPDNKVRFERQTDTTKAISSEYIVAGDFIHIASDGTIQRATKASDIDGIALDTGKYGENIRIRMPK